MISTDTIIVQGFLIVKYEIGLPFLIENSYDSLFKKNLI
jgi:hypothetical protein